MASEKTHSQGLFFIVNSLLQSGDRFELGWKPKIITLEAMFGRDSGQKQPDIWVVGNRRKMALMEYKCCDQGGTHYRQARDQLYSCRDYLQALFDCDPLLYYVWGSRFNFERV